VCVGAGVWVAVCVGVCGAGDGAAGRGAIGAGDGMLGRGAAAAGGAAGLGTGAGAGFGAGAGTGFGAGAGAGFGAAAAGFAAAGFAAAGFFAGAFAFTVFFADFFATFLALRFFATTFRRFAGAALFAFLAFLAFFAFFDFFAMIDLPIVRLPGDRARPRIMRGAPAIVITLPSYDPTLRSDRVTSPPHSPRHRAAGRPVDQLDRMDHRNIGAGRDLRDASDIAGGDHIGSDLRDIRDLAIA
jgi:hypothetical protein